MSAFEALKPYDSTPPKGYVLDVVEVSQVGEPIARPALMPERHHNSRTDLDEFPVVPFAMDVEGQRPLEARPPITLNMPKWLQPYVAEACGIATMIIIGLITNM